MRSQPRTQTQTRHNSAARIIHHAALLSEADPDSELDHDPLDDDNWNTYAGSGVPLIWTDEVDDNEGLDFMELSAAHDPVLDSASEWNSSRD
jgi:hypothetical protein